MTAFELVSIPFWASGVWMCATAVSISITPVENIERRRLKLTDCFCALIFAAVLLAIAAKMWSSIS